ncbi:hypothetical protein DYQ93_11440 [Xanthomonas sp. LMG 8992]|uniref:hypothetical protein n=1 Tax=Xanthomonas sp. LMG 8992 TaxID=1591157 RepID=UPI0013720259|nr:hypothetical protein [Xanthomonas sp. LMG 8992]MXV11633.1 hypothetical protein [Xanthomonas sp. LMG 8992]
MTKTLAPLNDSRGTSADDGRIGVLLDTDARPGVRAVGTYLPGTPYRVSPDEALRLVDAKGFAYTSEADARAAAAHRERLNAAAPPDTAVPAAVADGQGGGTPITSSQE